MRRTRDIFESCKSKAARWLRQGVTPRRLALTLSLGFVIGCFPVIGVTTALCAMIAFAFRLNLPAIQAANYAAMPFQVALLWPLARLGGKLTAWAGSSALSLSVLSQGSSHSSVQMLSRVGVIAEHALLAWLLIAGPVVLVLTATLTRVLNRVPAVAAVQTGR